MTLNAPQPPPLHDVDDNPQCWPALLSEGGVEPWLLALIIERDEMGRRKYGVPLRVWDGRDAVADAMQEALDLAVYLQRALMRVPKEDPSARSRLRVARNLALTVVRELHDLEGRVPR